MKKFVVDGNKFNTVEGFYSSIESIFTKNFKMDRNLDVFNDILRGGFGINFGKKACIKLINYEKMKKELGEEFLINVISIILDNDKECKFNLIIC